MGKKANQVWRNLYSKINLEQINLCRDFSMFCLPVLLVAFLFWLCYFHFLAPPAMSTGISSQSVIFLEHHWNWVSRSTTKHLVLVSLDRWWLFTLYSRNDGCRHVMRRRNVWREQRGDTCKQVDWPKVVPPQPWRHAAYHSIVMKWCVSSTILKQQLKRDANKALYQ